MKRILKSTLVIALLASVLTACGGGSTTKPEETPAPDKTATEQTGATNAGGDVYFLNFKPEVAEIYTKIAEEYEKETGKKVSVMTASAGEYEQTLKSEITKKEAPTIFQINGPVGYESWKDYTLDLKGSKLYDALIDKSMAVTSGEGVYGIPYVVEGYGIIYNNEIMDKYFALPEKKAKATKVDEITDFATLKEVVEDMQANKDKLGIQGVFASTSLKPGEDWRWQTHLSNIPFYYEFKENTAFDNTILAGLDAKEVEFKYAENFKNMFDLYINNSCTDKGLLGGKSVADSMAEFAIGDAAMIQNGNWAWKDINVDGTVVTAENTKYLPIYTGMPDDSKQSLSLGTENFFAVNSKVSEEQQQASLDFLYWLFSSETGKKFVTTDLGFNAPFNTFSESEIPDNPLAKEVVKWMGSGKDNIPWTFLSYPSQEFKDVFGSALLEYAQGNGDWDTVVTTVKDSWKAERAK